MLFKRSAPSRPEPIDLILHVGSGKTGTSSLQYFMRDNRDRLARHGLLYPQSPGRARHTMINLYTGDDDYLERRVAWKRESFASGEEFRRHFEQRLTAEIAEAGLPRMLLSDEALFSRPRRALGGLRELADRIARSVRVVVYLRRQDELTISRYQQAVKTGETMRLEEFITLPHSNSRHHLWRTRNWAEGMRPDRFVVRRFERSAFVGGSLYTDFLDAIGLEPDLTDLSTPLRRNDSLDADSVEFLRLLNLYQIEHEGATYRVIDNSALLVPLAEHSGGPTLSLPEDVLDRYMEHWAESNSEVAVRYLHDPSGVLFREHRKTTDTVTVQVLDPARVEEYASLLKLPEHWRAPLRAIAEREARAVTGAR